MLGLVKKWDEIGYVKNETTVIDKVVQVAVLGFLEINSERKSIRSCSNTLKS